MEVTPHAHLSRRERQIMDVVYRLGDVTVSDVLKELPNAPGYSAVRAMLRRLEDKGHVKHEVDGPRYVYTATRARDEAGESALERLIRTFFDGSASRTMAAILDANAKDLTPDELETLGRLIEQARRRGR